MYVGDVYLAKAIMAERMAEAERYRRSAPVRRPRQARPGTHRIARLRHRIHVPHVVRHRPV